MADFAQTPDRGCDRLLYWFTGEISPRYALWIALLIALLAWWLGEFAALQFEQYELLCNHSAETNDNDASWLDIPWQTHAKGI